MKRHSVVGLALAMAMIPLLTAGAFAADPQAVGYLVDPVEQNEEGENRTLGARFLRDGETFEATEGMAVFEGDIITTAKGGEVAVVFVDNSAVTLRESSALKIVDYAFPEKKVATHIELQDGNAFVAVNPRPDEAHFFIATKFSSLEVKGTKFVVINVPVTGTASYTTTVAVTDGTVTLTPNAKDAKSVDILAGMQLIMTVGNTNIPGFSGAKIDFSKGNIDKNQIKSLEAGAISFAEVVVKNGKVTIKSTSKNIDGSTTTTTRIEINGAVQSVNSKTTGVGSNKTVTKISVKGDRTTITRVTNEGKLTEKLKGTSGTLTLKSTSGTFKGTLTRNTDGSVTGTATNSKTGATLSTNEKVLADGSRTNIVDVTSSDGSRKVEIFTEKPDGTLIKTTATFAAGSTSGTVQIVTISPTGPQTTVTQTSTPVISANSTFPVVPGTEVKTVIGALPPFGITPNISTPASPDITSTTPVSP